MSVQVVAAKMAEVDLKDVPTGKDLPAVSPVSPTSEGKNEASSSAAAFPAAESSAKAGEGLLTPNPVKMPQASAMKRSDPQQNGGEAFVNRDGTVAEAPRMKKVRFFFFPLLSNGPPPKRKPHATNAPWSRSSYNANRLAGPKTTQISQIIQIVHLVRVYNTVEDVWRVTQTVFA